MARVVECAEGCSVAISTDLAVPLRAFEEIRRDWIVEAAQDCEKRLVRCFEFADKRDFETAVLWKVEAQKASAHAFVLGRQV